MGLEIVEGKGSFGGKWGHPVVTNGDFACSHSLP